MKNKVVLKAIVLVVSWLTISPLFLIYDGWWKLLPKWLRIVLFVFSPMVLIILFLVVVFANHAAVEHFHRYHFTKPRVIERITGVRFPGYKIIEYRGRGSGHGPAYYYIDLEFDDLPDEAFFEALEKHGDVYTDENDTARSFSFSKQYKYLSIGSYETITYGDASVTVKEGSQSFLISLFEWPDNNQFFQKDSELVDWETILKEYESDLATIKTSPCIHVDTDSLSVYYPNFSRIDLVTGVMPDRMDDSAVVFCCEAAFTGECLKEFKHTNIAGDHVSSGVRHRGYRCKRNTGAFVWYDDNWKFLWKEYTNEMDSAALHNGMGFGQEMIVHQGKLCETIRKDENTNQFRALCEVYGRVCVIDGKMTMPFGTFKKLLIAYGVTEALYLDMGAGWNYSWYRDENGNAVDIYPYQHPYCTNWITFYR